MNQYCFGLSNFKRLAILNMLAVTARLMEVGLKHI